MTEIISLASVHFIAALLYYYLLYTEMWLFRGSAKDGKAVGSVAVCPHVCLSDCYCNASVVIVLIAISIMLIILLSLSTTGPWERSLMELL